MAVLSLKPNFDKSIFAHFLSGSIGKRFRKQYHEE
jgi:hypothetical protein